jgi:hypothetical protein
MQIKQNMCIGVSHAVEYMAVGKKELKNEYFY